jgi:hypothetical protein
MQFATTERKLTRMRVQDLDKSSFIDYISQITLKHPKNININKPKDSYVKGTVASGMEELQMRASELSEVKIDSPKSSKGKKGFTSIKNGTSQKIEPRKP